MRFDDILLALIVRAPVSGYDAKKWLDTEGLFLRANADQSQIYRTLHRLRRAELISQSGVARGGGPEAKVYSATPAGLERLVALAHEPFEPQPRWQEPDFVARYVMLGVLWPATLPGLILTELRYRKEQVSRFRERERQMDLADSAMPIDGEVAMRVIDGAHAIGAAGADQWMAWLEGELAYWNGLYPEAAASLE